jgi:recombination protein RecA
VTQVSSPLRLDDAAPSSAPTARRAAADVVRVREAIRRKLAASTSSSSPTALPPERWGERLAPLPTGLAALDRALLPGGGLPRGELTEITGPLSSGKTSVAFSMIASVQRRGEPVAYVDPSRSFHAPSAARCGIDLGGLLLVRPPHEEEALRAADLLLRSRAFALVVIDLPGLRRVKGDGRSLFRLTRIAREVETALVALTTEWGGGASSPLRAAVGLRLSVRPGSCLVEGSAARLQGYRGAIEVTKDRSGGVGRAMPIAVRVPFPEPLLEAPPPVETGLPEEKRKRRRRPAEGSPLPPSPP